MRAAGRLALKRCVALGFAFRSASSVLRSKPATAILGLDRTASGVLCAMKTLWETAPIDALTWEARVKAQESR